METWLCSYCCWKLKGVTNSCKCPQQGVRGGTWCHYCAWHFPWWHSWYQPWYIWLDWGNGKTNNNFVLCKWLLQNNLALASFLCGLNFTFIPHGSWIDDWVINMSTSISSDCVNPIPHMNPILTKANMVEELKFDKGSSNFGATWRLAMAINYYSN